MPDNLVTDLDIRFLGRQRFYQLDIRVRFILTDHPEFALGHKIGFRYNHNTYQCYGNIYPNRMYLLFGSYMYILLLDLTVVI